MAAATAAPLAAERTVLSVRQAFPKPTIDARTGARFAFIRSDIENEIVAMKIDAAAIFPTRDRASAPRAAESQPTATTPIAASSSVTAASGGVTTADFTGMTRQELLDWVNDQIKTGRMTLDESTPFVGMTLKISAVTQQPVDIATDQTRENFIEKAQRGLEGALWRKDEEEARQLRFAIDTMQRAQGSPMRVDVRA